jgi:DNA-binding transcriptional MerR regulator
VRVLYFDAQAVEPTVEIPNRAAFKASEVCEIAQIPPYVLRSWEKEFPGLGAVARPGGPRIYRRSDLDQILRIKQLVFIEGLTLAGARRKLEGEPAEEDAALQAIMAPEDARARVAKAKSELRSLLEMLAAAPSRADSPHVPEPPGPSGTAPSSWPPTPGSTATPLQPVVAPDDELPLLEGRLDTPPSRHRRARKPAKQGGDPASPKVE